MLPHEPIAVLERRRAEVLGKINAVGDMRAGSLTERFTRCGKAGCHCAQPDDRGHGPVLSLTRQEAGKTITRIIPAHAEAETRALIAENRRFRQLAQEFAAVSTALSEARLAAEQNPKEQTAPAVKKGASQRRSRPRLPRKSPRS